MDWLTQEFECRELVRITLQFNYTHFNFSFKLRMRFAQDNDFVCKFFVHIS